MNPFRNALTTYDMLPPSLRPKLIPAMFRDWSDLEHNANPIEHDPCTHMGEAMEYVEQWEDGESNLDRQFLADMSFAWDHVMALLPEPDTTMFGLEKVSTGHYLSVDETEWPEEVTNDYTVTFAVQDQSEGNYEITYTRYQVRIVNHENVSVNVV